MKRIVKLYDTTWREDGEYKHSHSVSIYDQPFFRWLTYKLFHAFDMTVYKIPGFKLLDRLYPRSNDGFSMPLSTRMDLLCYDLGEKGKEVLYIAEIDEAYYASLSGQQCRWT